MAGKEVPASVLYERLVRDIYEGLAAQSAVTTIDIQHDVKVLGKAGKKRQIDVFWEFEVAGERYRTVIECKHYSRRVSGAVVDRMVSVLNDLGPGTTGVIVTTVGYQPLATAVAQDNGIRLLKVNTLLRRIEIAMNMGSTNFVNIKPVLNPASATTALDRAGRTTLSFDSIGQGPPLVDGAGKSLGTFLDAMSGTASGEAGHHVYSPEDTWVVTPIGPILLERVEFDAEVTSEKQLIQVEVPAARAIIVDVLENTKRYLRRDGTVGSNPR